MSERSLNVKDIILARAAEFRNHTYLKHYETGRTLEAQEKPHVEPLKGYLDILPVLKGKDFVEIVEKKIQKQSLVRILDVGCGQALFLKDCKQRWGQNVDCYGVTAFAYHKEKRQDNTIDQLGIKIKRADAQSLPKKIKPESFDIVTSIRTSIYVADPLAMLKGIHRVLKIGGTALIDATPILTSQPEDAKQLISYLRTQYEMQLVPVATGKSWSIAFEKSQDHLKLPVSFHRLKSITPTNRLMVYRFNPVYV